VRLVRVHDRALARAGELLRVPPERVADTVAALRARVRELERELRSGGARSGVDVDQLASDAVERDGVRMLLASVPAPDGKVLLEVADRLKNKLGEAVIVLGSAGEDRVDLIATVSPSLVARGLHAAEIVRAAATVVGGGGGGRDTMARAGGRNPDKLTEAIQAAREAIENALAGKR
jgi:alanyl-tRNA synthetase